MTIPQIEIRTHQPDRRRKLIYLILLLILLGVALFQLGYYWAGIDNSELKQQLEQSDQEISDLEQQARDYSAKVAMLERGRQVTEVADDEVKSQLRERQQEILELREEIAFYRGIVAPSETTTGIRVQRFELAPLAEERLFHYRLILTQVLKRNRVTLGMVEVMVLGVENGMPKQYSLEKIVAQPIKPMKFRFKYFQKFEGDILLPEGFLPHSIEVTVKPSKAKSRIEESFDWPGSGDMSGE